MESFEVSRKDDSSSVVVLFIKGYLDAHTAPMLENEIQALINENKFKRERGRNKA